MAIEQLLAKCAELMNRFGPDSDEVSRFIASHEEDREFVELANLSRDLKKAFSETPAETSYAADHPTAAVGSPNARGV
jgi:hypothetical protein